MNRNRFPSPLPQNDPPAPAGHLDATRGRRTPTYGYGWIAPYSELDDAASKALGQTPPPLQSFACQRWVELGYGEKYGPDTRPKLKAFYEEMRTNAVFVFTWKSASADDIASATSNLDVLEACRNTLGLPKILEKDPTWFLLGTKTVPDGYDYEFEDYKPPVMFVD